MTTTTRATAAALQAGDFLHRVQQAPRSAVFERPVDATVLSAAPHASEPGYVTVVLDTPYRTTLNLRTDRQVEFARLVPAPSYNLGLALGEAWARYHRAADGCDEKEYAAARDALVAAREAAGVTA